jgi:hypothetical protein
MSDYWEVEEGATVSEQLGRWMVKIDDKPLPKDGFHATRIYDGAWVVEFYSHDGRDGQHGELSVSSSHNISKDAAMSTAMTLDELVRLAALMRRVVLGARGFHMDIAAGGGIRLLSCVYGKHNRHEVAIRVNDGSHEYEVFTVPTQLSLIAAVIEETVRTWLKK